MTHIGIDTRLTYYRDGGIAAYTRRVIDALVDLDSTTDYTLLHSRKDSRTLAHAPNFKRASLWTPCHHRLEKWALTAELARFRLDLLHSPDFIPPLRGAKRHVITVHDLNFLHFPQFLTAESRRYYNDQIKRAVRQADHILADSEATKADIIAMLNVKPAKITVHMLGVDESFRPLPAADVERVRQQLALPEQFILFVGTFEPRKNITGLLDAYRQLRADLPDAPPLVLAGRRGWLYEDILAKVEKSGLAQHVLWREDTPQELMPALFNAATILAAPSFYEGFGLTALEAMACGTPTVAANRSSLPEVVGDTGILVNPDDTADIANGLHHLLTDTALYQQSSAAGLARAGIFTWAQTAQVVKQVYDQVLAL